MIPEINRLRRNPTTKTRRGLHYSRSNNGENNNHYHMVSQIPYRSNHAEIAHCSMVAAMTHSSMPYEMPLRSHTVRNSKA